MFELLRASCRECVAKDSASIRRIALAFPALQLPAITDVDPAASSSHAVVPDSAPAIENIRRNLKRHQSISSASEASKDPYDFDIVEQQQPHTIAV